MLSDLHPWQAGLMKTQMMISKVEASSAQRKRFVSSFHTYGAHLIQLVVEPPIWKICSWNWIIFPGIGMKIKNLWNHHLVIVGSGCFQSPVVSSYYSYTHTTTRNKHTQLGSGMLCGAVWSLKTYKETGSVFLAALVLTIFSGLLAHPAKIIGMNTSALNWLTNDDRKTSLNIK